MVRDEFEQMDGDAGVEVAVIEEVSDLPAIPGGVAAYQAELVRAYHKGASSLVERLRGEGKDDAQALVASLIEEVIGETDSLLGNKLLSIENGALRDASVIGYKRAEVIEKVIKAIQSKSQLERESGIDVDSPSMMVVFKYFMKKTKEVFERIEMRDEQSDLFFSTLGEATSNWKRELREEFEALKAR